MINTDRLQKQSGIIGNSKSIKKIVDLISQVAEVDISVLITGESGVGKEVIAKAVHKASNRSRKPLVTVNCGAIPEGIIESELFGHKKDHLPVQIKIEKVTLRKLIKELSF